MSSVNQKKREILILFYEPFKSGISRHIKYLLQTLQTENLEFRLICSSSDQEIPAFLKDVISKDSITMVPPGRFFALRGFINARRIIKEHNIDLVHVHNLQSALWGYCSTVLTQCNKIVFTPHVSSVDLDLNRTLVRFLMKILAPFTTCFIAVSKSQHDQFKRWGIASGSQVRLICNHLEKQDFQVLGHPFFDITKQSNVIPSTVNVTQVGRLDRQKNPLFLLRVIKKVTDKYKNCHFFFVGEGTLRGLLEKEIKKNNLGRYIELLGHRNDVYQLLEKTDIVTSTSKWEGLPYSLLEATFFKKAIVATDIPGHSDLITDGKSGFLTCTEQEFADCLCKLIQTKALRIKMGECGYKMNIKLFTIDNMHKQILDIYTTC